jgi:hypothetical protein
MKWGIEQKGEQQQEQEQLEQLKLFLGLCPMAADKNMFPVRLCDYCICRDEHSVLLASLS